MKVYILYENKDADEYGFGTRDDVVGIFDTREKAEKIADRYVLMYYRRFLKEF